MYTKDFRGFLPTLMEQVYKDRVVWKNKLIEAKNTYEMGQVTIQIEAIKGWIEYSKGNSEKAIEYMKLASKLESETSKAAVTPGEIIPADELLADLYLALNKPKKASGLLISERFGIPK